MRQLLMIGGLVLAAITVDTSAHAQGRPAGAGQGTANRPTATQPNERSAMRQQAETRRQEAEARRQEAATRRAEAETMNRSERLHADHPPNEHAADEAFAADEISGGSDNAGEMRDRRDARKAIQEEYRGNRVPGQEGADPDSDKETVADEQKAKSKKPWWKFWGN